MPSCKVLLSPGYHSVQHSCHPSSITSLIAAMRAAAAVGDASGRSRIDIFQSRRGQVCHCDLRRPMPWPERRHTGPRQQALGLWGSRRTHPRRQVRTPPPPPPPHITRKTSHLITHPPQKSHFATLPCCPSIIRYYGYVTLKGNGRFTGGQYGVDY